MLQLPQNRKIGPFPPFDNQDTQTEIVMAEKRNTDLALDTN